MPHRQPERLVVVVVNFSLQALLFPTAGLFDVGLSWNCHAGWLQKASFLTYLTEVPCTPSSPHSIGHRLLHHSN
jgi:hypothetical protein